MAEPQKNQRATKSLTQTQDQKLAESFAPITKNLEEVDKFTKKSGYLNEKASQIDIKTPNLF